MKAELEQTVTELCKHVRDLVSAGANPDEIAPLVQALASLVEACKPQMVVDVADGAYNKETAVGAAVHCFEKIMTQPLGLAPGIATHQQRVE